MGSRTGVRVRRVGVAAGVVLVLVWAGSSAFSGEVPALVETESVRVVGTPEADGNPVTLEGTLYLPADPSPRPAVLLAHGYGGSQAALADQGRALAEQGYVALAYSARGFGFSGGQIHLNSPRFEVEDARRMLDLLVEREEVQRDAAGDPRVGVVGASYGGALALLLAGTDRRVDAVVPSITWHDLRQALFPQFAVTGAQQTAAGVTPLPTPGVFKKQWAAVFFGSALGASVAATGSPPGPAPGPAPSAAPGQAPDDFGPDTLATACGRLAGDLCLGYLQAATTGRPSPELLALLAASSPASVAGRITAPTLLVQGEADSLFPLSEADANARAIAAAGTPVALAWTGGGHDGGVDESAREAQLTREFLDQVLGTQGRFRGDITGPGFRVTVPDAVVSSLNDADPIPQQRVRGVVPGLGGEPLPLQQVPLTGDEQLIIAPPGATPAALTSLPGVGGALGLLGQAAGSGFGGGGPGGGGTGVSLNVLPGQAATFDTPVFERTTTVTGSSRVSLRVRSTARDAVLFASLLDVAPGGAATLPQQLVAPVRLERLPSEGVTVTVALPGIVHDVQAGHRLRLVVATTDQAYALPQDPRGYRVALAEPQLSVPVVPLSAVGAGGSRRGLLIFALVLLGGLVLLVAAAAVAGRRLATRDRERVDGDVPLRITGLGKAYGDGFRAVSDLSFDVEAGQVLGLLGPNGAGKTTTLRMLMGLIAPSEGEIRVFGHRVRPGAPVLSRVGAFVEGPGFLPHLTGMENLTLYWRATGRPEADARLDIALEVAGLGDDVHRQVRTYSQGMRQRLAIAQAMLGLPELLVLDEPTNGLDPPQIREMREVLQRYAATGRTVLVSSHLLGEVEQTCSHVVVMARGRLVAQGPVAELVGQAGTLVLDVDDPARAATVARGVAGVRDVAAVGEGLVVHAERHARAPLVAALVGAGVAVERVAPQRGLEETFLNLVGGED